jgi:hypothetical protein
MVGCRVTKKATTWRPNNPSRRKMYKNSKICTARASDCVDEHLRMMKSGCEYAVSDG